MPHPARVFAPVIAALLFAFVLVGGMAHAALSFPQLTGRVVDEAGILSPETKQRLTGMLAAFEQKTGDQFVIATLKDTGGTDIADYGYQLGRAWGIGQKGKNNGIMLLVAPNSHQVRIEVGYGLEGDMTDAQSALIIDNAIRPLFRKGDYDGGVMTGAVNVMRTLGFNPSGTEAIPEPQPRHGSHGGVPLILIVIILWVVFGRFLWPLLFIGGIGRGPWGGGGFGGGSFGGGSFGGGFSGGGGSFGGGGASGSW